MRSLAEVAAGRPRVAPLKAQVGVVERFEQLLDAWPKRCRDNAARAPRLDDTHTRAHTPSRRDEPTQARRQRRQWRRRAMDLLAEHGGLPAEVRKRAWSTVLEAAVESPKPAAAAPAAASPAPSEDASAASPAAATPAEAARRNFEAAPGGESGSSCGSTAAEPKEEEEEEDAEVAAIAANARRAGGDDDAMRWARARRRSDTGRLSPSDELPREIALDVPRTFHGAEEAAPDAISNAKLRRLLTHFARTASEDMKYCQGMNFLGGALLRVFDDGASGGARTTTVDAGTYNAFRGLMALVTPLYVPDFRGLRELVAVAGALLPKFAPRLARVLDDEGLDLMPIASGWCLTLFASSDMADDLLLCCWDFLLLGTPSRRELLLEQGEERADYASGDESDREPPARAASARAAAAAPARRSLLRSATSMRWSRRKTPPPAPDAGERPECATSERHVVLLRLCLVMLRLGDEAIEGDADGLEALSLLGSRFFPASPEALCGLLARTTVDGRAARAAARAHARDRAADGAGAPPRPRKKKSVARFLSTPFRAAARRKRVVFGRAKRRADAAAAAEAPDDDPALRSLPNPRPRPLAPAAAPAAAPDEDPSLKTL